MDPTLYFMDLLLYPIQNLKLTQNPKWTQLETCTYFHRPTLSDSSFKFEQTSNSYWIWSIQINGPHSWVKSSKQNLGLAKGIWPSIDPERNNCLQLARSLSKPVMYHPEGSSDHKHYHLSVLQQRFLNWMKQLTSYKTTAKMEGIALYIIFMLSIGMCIVRPHDMI